MSFPLPHFTPPDFSLPRFSQAPDAVLVPSPQDKVAPEQYHATTIFPEYFKIGGQWLLAKESRMDCVAVYENGNISIRSLSGRGAPAKQPTPGITIPCMICCAMKKNTAISLGY